MLAESCCVSFPLLVLQCDVDAENVVPVLSASFSDSLVSITCVEVVNDRGVRVPCAIINSFLIELLGEVALAFVSREIEVRICLMQPCINRNEVG